MNKVCEHQRHQHQQIHMQFRPLFSLCSSLSLVSQLFLCEIQKESIIIPISQTKKKKPKTNPKPAKKIQNSKYPTKQSLQRELCRS